MYPKPSIKVLLLMILLIGGLSRLGAQCPPGTANHSIASSPNTYYPGNSPGTVNTGARTLTLGAAQTGFDPIVAGDLLLLIQMQGSRIGTSNDDRYGSGDASGGGAGYVRTIGFYAGNFEFIRAAEDLPLTGGSLRLQEGITQVYRNNDFSVFGQYRYQVVRIAQARDLTLTDTIRVPAWNGRTGGVLILSASNRINFNGQHIDGAGRGFRGGAGRQLTGGTGNNTDYVTSVNNSSNASKGEGISGTPRYLNQSDEMIDNIVEGYPSGSYARGAPGNAGGGGTDGTPNSNEQNTGGGGGGNGAAGGRGGNASGSSAAVGGIGGAGFEESSASRLVMGGGGGAGSTSNGTGDLPAGLASSGGAGGGLVILISNSFTGVGSVSVKGLDGNSTVVNDGSGGGGAGGSVLIYAGNGTANLRIDARGGNGGSNTGQDTEHGPGGGGAGGLIISNLPVNAGSSVAAGMPGTTLGGSHFGAEQGQPGMLQASAGIAQYPPGISGCGNVLPVKFLDLTASWSGSNATLRWTVTQESQVAGYLVERSIDGTRFEPISEIEYRATASAINSYDFTDPQVPSSNHIWYRIRENDLDGRAVYSRIVMLSAGPGNTALHIFPNPVTDQLNIQCTLGSGAMVMLRIVNAAGSLVWNKEMELRSGNNTVSVDVAHLADGIYTLQCWDGSSMQTSRLVKRRR